ncbi:DUF3861 domain-containing protein [Hymenobacter cellulosilyticus]|uniref:DUF3861 domain-containing protein n=1 Tax=Hymenobacter cellulosilyticus TaxID=2932248 RepID=A0A8T9QBG1_9BACT|nr:DUF3861 domain-containing protein [Hymenobacter cellulosilyticus]UOQ74525.1 DUF3861 domain-containing protein [Hymenobacter cellulosilyticus]
MNKRAYSYRLRLEQVAGIQPDSPQPKPIELTFGNHDDIFQIIERLQQRDLFQEPEQSTEFAIGLKLFSEVMLKNRQHPLFEEFAPAFREFMQRLKTS